MAIVVSLINMKGGVGKTTIASQLAHAADADGLKVLAIDLDPQSNLSQSILGSREYVDHLNENEPSVVQVLDDYVPATREKGSPTRVHVTDVILKGVGYWNDTELDLIPSRLELSRTLKKPTHKANKLAEAISQIEQDYDLILIDCAPTESILTDAAYFASRYVIVPIKPEFMATIGLPLLERSLREFRLENEDHKLDIAGLVLNSQSEYASNAEKAKARRDVHQIAMENDWHIFRYESRSYAQASRRGLPLAQTPHAKTERVIGIDRLKNEIFDTIGLRA